ncbi:MAG: GTP-binding protein EngA [uncultured Campylobacterales bacterium]|uniref:GTPase Der n=1 Tax=uncultured Campylobacterales bacterium TaxID=352960 RepID=A0A6S6SG77_9BACT|nr:MAG: GTP-binding protein EngA [uncultured Campylobacterales bacterium]
MTKIALIGKPNVGKSSLFNRLAGSRIAITSDFSGTTRDINEHVISLDDKEFLLFDTGGLDDSSDMFVAVKNKSLQAANKADIIVFMVDGKSFPDDDDKKIFFELQQMGKEIALLINKVDSHNDETRAWEFISFGAETVFNISVSHNKGVNDLKRWIYALLPKKDEVTQPIIEDEVSFEDLLLEENVVKKEVSNDIKIAILGRVNVGKSSLLNALLREDKAVVSEQAGTTIDPVDEEIIYAEKKLTFVDTAGIRKRSKILGIEKFALDRTTRMLENANIALLVLDASEEFKELDERIASYIDKYTLGCIIVLNKWDKARDDYKKVVEDVRYRFKFLSYAPVLTVSALTKQRVHRILDKILEVHENYSRRISTSKLNDFMKKVTAKHSIPTLQGKTVKIYFTTQYDTQPPRIALVMNRAKLHFSYRRYIINNLRDEFDFEGSPVLLKAKERTKAEDADVSAGKKYLSVKEEQGLS